MLMIRLQRTGRTNDPSYRVVVTEHTNGPKSGRAVEKVGAYNPKSKERTLNAERILYWISKGAKPSGTMHNMLISAGITTGKKINVLPKKTVPKKEEVAAPAAAPEAKAEEVKNEVKEEVATEEPKKDEAPAQNEVAAETSAQA